LPPRSTRFTFGVAGFFVPGTACFVVVACGGALARSNASPFPAAALAESASAEAATTASVVSFPNIVVLLVSRSPDATS
jgi:hypothetical protein